MDDGFTFLVQKLESGHLVQFFIDVRQFLKTLIPPMVASEKCSSNVESGGSSRATAAAERES